MISEVEKQRNQICKRNKRGNVSPFRHINPTLHAVVNQFKHQFSLVQLFLFFLSSPILTRLVPIDFHYQFILLINDGSFQ